MYIIRHEVAGYHQCRALYVIITEFNTRWCVMIYSPKGWWYPPHFVRWWYTKPAACIKKVVSIGYDFFGVKDGTFACATIPDKQSTGLFSPTGKSLFAIFSLIQAPSAKKKNRTFRYGSSFLVWRMGLEPTRITIRPSNVRVCQFRHPHAFQPLYITRF